MVGDAVPVSSGEGDGVRAGEVPMIGEGDAMPPLSAHAHPLNTRANIPTKRHIAIAFFT